MANTTFLTDFASLDVDTYLTAQKTDLKSQSIFQDYNFDGSNIAVLLELLAKNTYFNAFLLNMVGSEAFLDSATLRESVVSRAKELNYVPRSRNSAKALVNIVIGTSNTLVSTITIPKGYYFSTQDNTDTVLFSTNESILVRNEGGSFLASNVEIYEGRLATEYFVANSSAQFIISSPNIDIDSLEVSVQTSVSDTTTVAYTRALDLYGLDSTSLVYFVEGYSRNFYQLRFGNDVTGKALDDGNVVIVTYRDTLGVDGNGFNRFTKVRAINDTVGNIFTDITATTVEAATGGAERETIDSIKFNAPRHFAAQNRAVTKDDFKILLKENFPSIQAISVFGGEELAQKQYGRVIIATKPYDGEVTPQTTKTSMNTFLANKVAISITPVFADPDYFYIEITATVHYDPALTQKTPSDIATLTRTAIDNYNTTFLYDFNADFRYSKMVALIDNADTSIVSNDTDVRMIKRLTPIVDFSFTQTIIFNNSLKTSTVDSPAIESDLFSYIHTDGNTYSAKIVDDTDGGLTIVTSAGLLLASGVGTVNMTTGTVLINSVIIHAYEGHINLYARLLSKDIIANQTQILNIDQTDVTVDIEQARS
jgi:hypothetical protein